jgi:hypothetical protein
MSESSTGHLKWGDWFLDYGVFGQEGLCLVGGYFRGQRMFNKLSLPVIRVKYTVDEFAKGLSAITGDGCGPYNDQITWDTEDFGEDLNPIAGPHHLVEVVCPRGDRYLCTENVDIGGVPHLRISVYARIGAYHIAQTWTLNNDGWVMPRVSSKGLSCNLDHWHHPYWRFDFALGAPEVHRVAVHRKNGHKLADIQNEGMIVNDWFGRDIEYRITSTQPPDIGTIRTPAEAVIQPPVLIQAEGIVGPTPFSPLDGYVRKYRPEEDRNWPHKPEDEISFGLHELCVDADIVFWSISHLSHHADEGKDHWHTVGPNLHFQPMVVANVPPETLRKVLVNGTISVKDFGVFKDRWAHSTFSDQVFVNPNVRFQEVVKTLVQGDVTAELIILVDWQLDMSVNVTVVANLFDELERVARVEGAYNVPRDTSASGAKTHLVDHHGGDPDTADMELRVENLQQ